MQNEQSEFSPINFNSKSLNKILAMKMPYGKYKGVYLLDLPEPYVVWYHREGFPKGELGKLLHTVYEIKLNGLEKLLRPLRNKSAQ